ncbi:hypothetical protein ACU635_33615 [[Actinomadura] parvosata]|uniref:hypothetical protein n=1 Tax=[Actinomadura] parvosata TaxID=1955412 RepID=UPI00406CF123
MNTVSADVDISAYLSLLTVDGALVRVGADVEVISADQINATYERVLASDVRYRFVIDTATLA